MHLDTVGPLTTVGLGNYRYYLILTDDFSHYRWVSTLVTKGEGFAVIEIFLRWFVLSFFYQLLSYIVVIVMSTEESIFVNFFW